MGQRTQVVIKVTEVDGSSFLKAYHYQWGHGRVMLMAFMNMVTANALNKREKEFQYELIGGSDISIDEHDDNELKDSMERQEISELDPANVYEMTRIFEYFDNNDGGLVINVVRTKESEYSGIDDNYTIGFLKRNHIRGSKELYHTKYYKASDYMKDFPRYCDANFKKAFNSFVKHFEVEYFKNYESESDYARHKALEVVS